MSFKFDPRTILEHPIIYTNYQKLVGGYKARRRFVEEHVDIKSGQRILDIGCGPGDILDFLPQVDYIGIDLDENYIEKARKKYAQRGRFICSGIENLKLKSEEKFDFVIASGVLHHLDNSQCKSLFSITKDFLVRKGKFLSLDGCYVENQNRISRYLLNKDRGKYVRNRPEYETLAKTFFENVDSKIEENYFNIPYTLLIMHCS